MVSGSCPDEYTTVLQSLPMWSEITLYKANNTEVSVELVPRLCKLQCVAEFVDTLLRDRIDKVTILANLHVMAEE